MTKEKTRLPSMLEVVVVITLFLFSVFAFTVILDLPIQLAIFIGWFVVIALGLKLGYEYSDLQNGLINGIHNGMEAVLILIAVGALIGTWIAGGIVPSIIYYGLEIINPRFFLVTATLICAITSLATGTSWGTIGTAGIAMMAIGEGMGIPLPLVAGAVLSGAYFGDKLSPISDSVILASSMSEVDVIEHIKSMLYLDVPAIAITCILYMIAGSFYNLADVDMSRVQIYMSAISDNFDVSIIMLVPMFIVILLLALKKPSIPTLAFGSLLGVIWAVLFQGMEFNLALGTAYDGYSINSGIEFLDILLNRGGIAGMLDSIVVIMLGLGYGGLLEKVGILDVVASLFKGKITNAGNLTIATIFVGFLGCLLGSAMYVSLILTPKIMQNEYDRLGIDRRVLARNTEVGATLTAGMVPWSDNGIYMSYMLGVPTLQYVPFMWFSFTAIILAIIYGYTNKFIWYTKDKSLEK